MKNHRRVIGALLGTPLGLTVLWLAAETFTSEMPGTALVMGLVGLLILVTCIGLLFYVFRE